MRQLGGGRFNKFFDGVGDLLDRHPMLVDFIICKPVRRSKHGYSTVNCEREGLWRSKIVAIEKDMGMKGRWEDFCGFIPFEKPSGWRAWL